MRIGISANALKHSGGLERYAMDLVRGLAAAGFDGARKPAFFARSLALNTVRPLRRSELQLSCTAPAGAPNINAEPTIVTAASSAMVRVCVIGAGRHCRGRDLRGSALGRRLPP